MGISELLTFPNILSSNNFLISWRKALTSPRISGIRRQNPAADQVSNVPKLSLGQVFSSAVPKLAASTGILLNSISQGFQAPEPVRQVIGTSAPEPSIQQEEEKKSTLLSSTQDPSEDTKVQESKKRTLSEALKRAISNAYTQGLGITSSLFASSATQADVENKINTAMLATSPATAFAYLSSVGKKNVKHMLEHMSASSRSAKITGLALMPYLNNNGLGNLTSIQAQVDDLLSQQPRPISLIRA